MTFEEVEQAISLLIRLHQESQKTIAGMLETTSKAADNAYIANENAKLALELGQSTLTRIDKLAVTAENHESRMNEINAALLRLEQLIENHIRSLRNGQGGHN